MNKRSVGNISQLSSWQECGVRYRGIRWLTSACLESAPGPACCPGSARRNVSHATDRILHTPCTTLTLRRNLFRSMEVTNTYFYSWDHAWLTSNCLTYEVQCTTTLRHVTWGHHRSTRTFHLVVDIPSTLTSKESVATHHRENKLHENYFYSTNIWTNILKSQK